jgi:acyl-CoA synthetase (AMP-forming)/AMP-acid ligase II
MPDARLGEVGAAFILPVAGVSVDEAELRELAAQQLANYKRPRRYVFVDAFPVNASGKIRKQDLAAGLADAPVTS